MVQKIVQAGTPKESIPIFVRFRTLVDLCGEAEESRTIRQEHQRMLADPLVDKLVEEVNAWERQRPITRHNDAVHPLHKLVFAADIGVDKELLEPAVKSIVTHQSADGPFQVRIEIASDFWP